MKKIFLNAIVVAAGVSVLWQTTNGFTTFTSEQLRRSEVRANPIELPKVVLGDQDKQTLSIQDYQGRLLLLDFIFTHCSNLCPRMTNNMQKLYQQTENAAWRDEVFLLTVSFDPQRDTPDRLKAYGKQFGADFHRWKFASAKQSVLQELLDAVGIVVIPQDDGQFQHNAAVHIVDRQSRLADIRDYEKLDVIVEAVDALMSDRMEKPGSQGL